MTESNGGDGASSALETSLERVLAELAPDQRANARRVFEDIVTAVRERQNGGEAEHYRAFEFDVSAEASPALVAAIEAWSESLRAFAAQLQTRNEG